MKIQLVVVGGVRGVLRDAVEHYETRAGHYWKLEIVEVDAGAPGRAPGAERVREAEAARIEARIPDERELWGLTRDGRGWSSERWATELEERGIQATGDVALVIGGAFGLHEGLLKRARHRVSLGPVTLPHEMARLVLVEQLYRAGTIIRKEPYHKGTKR